MDTLEWNKEWANHIITSKLNAIDIEMICFGENPKTETLFDRIKIIWIIIHFEGHNIPHYIIAK